jgi:hypothetical protein
MNLKDPGHSLGNGISETYYPIEQLFGDYSDLVILFLIFIFFIISIIFIVNLWRKEMLIRTKLLWSIILLVPLIGLCFYGYFLPSEIKKN